MIPLAGDWTDAGRDSVGYYDARFGSYHLREGLAHGSATVVVWLGPPHMIPLTGEWFRRAMR